MSRKKSLAIIAITLWMSFTAFSQTLSQADRDRALKYLESTKQGVVDATANLSEAQWNFKAAPDRWSVAEVTEHIAAAEGYLRGLILEKALNAPPRAEGEDVKAIDEMVLSKVPDRSHKAQAPDPLKPTNRYGSAQGSLKAFLDSRQETIHLLETRDDLRAHAMDSPMGKKLDSYEWILFIGAHSERHTKQILEVKADPNFPKE